MMIIVRHSEIYTKSEPVQTKFVSRLANNMRLALLDTKVISKHWRILVESKNEKKAAEQLKKVFGIASISVAEQCDLDMEKIIALAKKIKIKGKFAVRVKRVSKSFPLNSQQIADKVGAEIEGNVDLSNPDTIVYIEILNDKAYVFNKVIDGPRGLPLGSAGEATSILENENDVLACWMMMKRGIRPNFYSKNKKLKKKLDEWALGYSLKFKTKKYISRAVITGTTDLKKFKETVKQYPDKLVLAPLIGFDKKDLNELKKRI